MTCSTKSQKSNGHHKDSRQKQPSGRADPIRHQSGYTVDQVKKVLPTDTSDLTIVDGEDYVTLVTCVPIAVNSHRLLVRGTRTE